MCVIFLSVRYNNDPPPHLKIEFHIGSVLRKTDLSPWSLSFGTL